MFEFRREIYHGHFSMDIKISPLTLFPVNKETPISMGLLERYKESAFIAQTFIV